MEQSLPIEGKIIGVNVWDSGDGGWGGNPLVTAIQIIQESARVGVVTPIIDYSNVFGSQDGQIHSFTDNNVTRFHIRSGAAIDMFGINDADHSAGSNGGRAGIALVEGLDRIVVKTGNYFWGSSSERIICELNFHYDDGSRSTGAGSSSYCSNVEATNLYIGGKVTGVNVWTGANGGVGLPQIIGLQLKWEL